MDDVDRNNALVLMVFAIGIVAVIIGYLLAWRSKRATYRKTGALVTASVAGFAGFVMLMWLMGAIMPLPPPDGEPLWKPLAFFLLLSPIPLGAFYICAKFIRQAFRDGRNSRLEKGGTA